MSYRALLTIKEVGQDGFDFRLTLGEDWKQAEILAELALRARSAPEAVKAVMAQGDDPLSFPTKVAFSTPEVRKDWIADYADESWEVVFHESGGAIYGEITGRDAGEGMIFYRKKAWLKD